MADEKIPASEACANCGGTGLSDAAWSEKVERNLVDPPASLDRWAKLLADAYGKGHPWEVMHSDDHEDYRREATAILTAIGVALERHEVLEAGREAWVKTPGNGWDFVRAAVLAAFNHAVGEVPADGKLMGAIADDLAFKLAEANAALDAERKAHEATCDERDRRHARLLDRVAEADTLKNAVRCILGAKENEGPLLSVERAARERADAIKRAEVAEANFRVQLATLEIAARELVHMCEQHVANNSLMGSAAARVKKLINNEKC